jgi:protein TonB
MFVESLVESTPLLRNQSRVPALISVAVQCALVALLIAIPILHPEVLQPAHLRLSVLAPPPLPAPKPPPVPRPHVETAVAASAPSAPTPASPVIAVIRGWLAPSTPTVDAPLLTIGTTMGNADSGPSIAIAENSPTIVLKPAANTKPTRVSGGVTAGLLLTPIAPIYPAIARTTGTQGTVVIEAIISKTGHIESAHAISGPIILQGAALDAVRAARYHPYLLNGEPTEVETTININFRMSS